MATFLWTILAVATMIGMFGACVVAVTVGVRMLENALAKRRRKQAG
jgi:hypothetical protein